VLKWKYILIATESKSFGKFYCLSRGVSKVTIRSRFSRTVPIFDDVSLKKITVLPGCPFVPFLAWCPRFVSTLTDILRYFTVWILILTCWSLNLKGWTHHWTHCCRLGLCSGPCWGSSRCSPSWTSDGSWMWRLHPIRLTPSALVPDCGDQIMATGSVV